MHRFDLARIGKGLVVAEAASDLEFAAAQESMVVTAPPGTGKTTFVPPLVANLLAQKGRVLLAQPRRVAVRAAARRLAELDGSDVGDAVGFTVRGERRVGKNTAIEVLTPGVLLRRLLTDNELQGVGGVILDEVHERSLESDLLLGMLAELRQLRDDLLIVAMSATLDAERVSEVLGEAPIVHVPALSHPLEIGYSPYAGTRIDERGTTRPYLAHVAALATRVQRDAQCDVLVFVPGAREVDDTVRLLREQNAAVDVLPLHGRVSSRDQDRAVRGRQADDLPRIIVSTSLAESSLTVPGVHAVVDTGLAREVRRDRIRDMTGLVTVSASRASADQRAGRAARTGPGRVIRAYSEADFGRMSGTSPPEIASADLTDAALQLAAWGTPGGRGMLLPTPPPEPAMTSAERVLEELALVDGDGRPTDSGLRVARMPVGVREARALLEGASLLGEPRAAAEVIAAISDDHRAADSSLPRLLRELRSGRSPGAARWRRERDRLERLADQTQSGPDDGDARSTPVPRVPNEEVPGAILALARPDWIARRAAEHSRDYLFASGTRAALPEASSLLGSEWIAVREVQRSDARSANGTGAIIRLAAPLSESTAVALAGPLLARSRTATVEQGRVRARLERHLGAIKLETTPEPATPQDVSQAFNAYVRDAGVGVLEWSPAAETLRDRLALIREALGDPWPVVSDEALLERLDEWLTPDLERLRANESLQRLDVTSSLRRLLPWPEASRFDALAPEHLIVPSGSRIPIDYSGRSSGTRRPIVAVKLQEVFGLAETPRLVDGRVPVQFHLLSPARRPLAVTDDLRSFWDGSYQQVRSEMRGRYPKHPWPEDPWSAEATSRTTRGSTRR